ncbi:MULTISPECIES: hypothetical protein [unclassified Streptomyces]|uniref:hypothetical protein n=1 Tax=unclassified Streptomyces TaxID=2593676 RepID=UPI00364B899D
MRHKIAAVVGSVGLALTLGLATAGSAHAGSRGQQIMVLDNGGTAKSFLVRGNDQDGNPVRRCFSVSGYQTWISGWWWRDNMTVYWYDYSTSCNNNNAENASYSWSVNIPVTSSNDWQAIGRPGNTTLDKLNRQIEFFDNQHVANSVLVVGVNQDGRRVTGCWATPGWETPFSGWWWKFNPDLYLYSSSDCSGGYNSMVKTGMGGRDGTWYGATN